MSPSLVIREVKIKVLPRGPFSLGGAANERFGPELGKQTSSHTAKRRTGLRGCSKGNWGLSPGCGRDIDSRNSSCSIGHLPCAKPLPQHPAH